MIWVVGYSIGVVATYCMFMWNLSEHFPPRENDTDVVPLASLVWPVTLVVATYLWSQEATYHVIRKIARYRYERRNKK